MTDMLIQIRERSEALVVQLADVARRMQAVADAIPAEFQS